MRAAPYQFVVVVYYLYKTAAPYQFVVVVYYLYMTETNKKSLREKCDFFFHQAIMTKMCFV